MDLVTLFSYVLLGFFSSLPTSHGQWGINWGWLPGSIGTLKPVRLHGHNRILKQSRVLWRPLKHDLVLEHDSSDSSDDSDGYKHRLIRKLKRRLNKKRRVNVKRKKANIIIEMLIRKKLLAKNKKRKSGKKSVKNNVPGPRIHKIDKIKNNFKVMSKSKLVDRLGDRFLTDFDYPDLGTSGFKISGSNQFPINKEDISKSQNLQPELTNLKEIKHTSGGVKINNIQGQNQQIDIGENEYEEENQNVGKGKSTTDEIEMEETTTAQDVGINKFTASAKPTSSPSSQDGGEQEIEAEDTTTKAATTHTSKSEKQPTAEQEIEPEETTTKPSITTTVSSKTKSSSTGEQEIEAEETTTQQPTKGTTPARQTITQWHQKTSGVDGTMNTALLGIDKTSKPNTLTKTDLLKPPNIFQTTAGKAQAIPSASGSIIPLRNATFDFRPVSSSSKTDDKLSTGITGIQKKSGASKIVTGFTVGSPASKASTINKHVQDGPIISENALTKHPASGATIQGKEVKGGPTFSDNVLHKQQDIVIGPEQNIPKSLGSNHPPVPGAEAVLSVPGEKGVIREPTIPTPNRDVSVPTQMSKETFGSAWSNQKQTISSQGKFGSGRPRISDNTKPEPGNQGSPTRNILLQINERVNSLGKEKLDRPSGGPGTQTKNILQQINKNVNNVGREKLEFSGKIFQSQPSINLQKKTAKSSDSRINNKIPLAKKAITGISSGNIHGQPVNKNRNILKSNINGMEQSNLKHLPIPKKLQKHGITHLQPIHGNAMQMGIQKSKSGSNSSKGLNNNRVFQFAVNSQPKRSQDKKSKGINNNNVVPSTANDQPVRSQDKTSKGLNNNSMFPSTANSQLKHSHRNILSLPTDKTAVNILAKDNTFTKSGQMIKKAKALAALKNIIGNLNKVINATKSHGDFQNAQTVHQIGGQNQQNDKISVRKVKPGLGIHDTGLRAVNTNIAGVRVDNSGLLPNNAITSKATDLQDKQQKSVSTNKLLPGVDNAKSTIQWHHTATSKPIIKDGGTFRESTPISGSIEWHHRATSKPVFTESPFKSQKPQLNIAWGPRATSRPVTSRIQENVIHQQTNAGTSIQGNSIPGQTNAHTTWQQTSNTIPVGTIQSGSIHTGITKGHISNQRHTISPHLKSGKMKTGNQMPSVSTDLLDRLRNQNTRNLGSNRGRVTIMDVGNSSKVLPISNKQATSKINNKIQNGETLTSKWVKSVRPQAVEVATELEGTWKDANMTMIGGAASTCPVYKILYQNNTVVFDTVENKCRTVITWHKKTKREQIRENTWFGVNVYYRDRPYYIPVVTYLDLAKVQ